MKKSKTPGDGQTALLAAGKTDVGEKSGVSESVYIEENHARAETVTPLLKEILDIHPDMHWEN